MKRGFWWQLIGISLAFTLLSGGISLLLFRSASAPVLQESRRNMYLFLANIVESADWEEGIRRYQRFRADSPSIGRSIWILKENGQVLASNTVEAPPAAWQQLPKPRLRHEISAKVPGLRHFADLVLVRLDRAEPTYLLVRPEKDTPNRALVGVEIKIVLLGLFITSFTGLSMIFVYLRRTSREARDVIARLHRGQLDARFTIRKFDEISNLKLDFNAMADEIEQLVQRVKAVEATRRDLLQELSHDLRTPLTSLGTAIESLRHYHARMTPEQQSEFLHLAQNELDYFKRLLEDLFLIADLGEASHAHSHQRVDLRALCEAELASRPLTHGNGPQWQWRDLGGDATLTGDAHLLQRLLRNCLDNAGKYATTRVLLGIEGQAQQVLISIIDDGPGMSEEARQQFGMRRRHRLRNDCAQAGVSLGLGSVIIKAVMELHGGKVQVKPNPAGQGTLIELVFPRR